MNPRPGGPNRPEPDVDPFAEYDAAYVFGSLSPEDRAAFERHLQHCEDCSAAVAAMAGVPGLLSRVPLERVIGTDDAAPVPDTLLPRLVAEVAQQRTRSRWRVGAAMTLAAACVLGLLVALIVDRPTHRATVGGPAGATSSSATRSGAPTTGPSSGPTSPNTFIGPVLTMTPVRPVGVTVTVQIQSLLWGTRITLKCDEARIAAHRSYSGEYHLVVVTRDNSRRYVAEWNSVAGKTVAIEGDTALRRADIASLQLVDADRDVLLRLAL